MHLQAQKQALRVKEERRASVRYAHSLRTSCRPLGKEATTAWAATVENVSKTGAALLTDREVSRGAVLVIALEALGGRFARPLLVRVASVRPGAAGRWQVGCTFVKPLTDDDVQALLLAVTAD